MHHRKYRSRGGDHSPANLAHLCGGASGLAGGNHSGCHGLAHSADPPEGWSIPSGIADPATTAFRTLAGLWLIFTAAGTAEPTTPPT